LLIREAALALPTAFVAVTSARSLDPICAVAAR
jgi:hypothetical protein